MEKEIEMLDIEIHGTGSRSIEARHTLLESTRRAFVSASYIDILTFVDADTHVLDAKGVQSMPFIRIYGRPETLTRLGPDLRNRLIGLFSKFKSIQITYVDATLGGPKE